MKSLKEQKNALSKGDATVYMVTRQNWEDTDFDLQEEKEAIDNPSNFYSGAPLKKQKLDNKKRSTSDKRALRQRFHKQLGGESKNFLF